MILYTCYLAQVSAANKTYNTIHWFSNSILDSLPYTHHNQIFIRIAITVYTSWVRISGGEASLRRAEHRISGASSYNYDKLI